MGQGMLVSAVVIAAVQALLGCWPQPVDSERRPISSVCRYGCQRGISRDVDRLINLFTPCPVQEFASTFCVPGARVAWESIPVGMLWRSSPLWIPSSEFTCTCLVQVL